MPAALNSLQNKFAATVLADYLEEKKLIEKLTYEDNGRKNMIFVWIGRLEEIDAVTKEMAYIYREQNREICIYLQIQIKMS